MDMNAVHQLTAFRSWCVRRNNIDSNAPCLQPPAQFKHKTGFGVTRPAGEGGGNYQYAHGDLRIKKACNNDSGPRSQVYRERVRVIILEAARLLMRLTVAGMLLAGGI